MVSQDRSKAKRKEAKSPYVHQGYTFIELCVSLSVVTILACLAFAGYSSQIDSIQLRRAARDLYTYMYSAKIEAIKDNISHRIIFDPTPGQAGYSIWSEGPNSVWDDQTGDDILERSVRLTGYGEGITFGKGNAHFDATVNKGKIPKDGISYQDNDIRFHTIGTIGKFGYVYFRNQKGENYAVGTPVFAGVIVLKKWKTDKWE